MRSTPNRLASVLALIALGVAIYALLVKPPASSDADLRIADLEERLARLERSPERASDRAPGEPTLRGAGVGQATGGRSPLRMEGGDGSPASSSEGEREAEGAVSAGTTPGSTAAELRELVDEAVEKKAAQIQSMANKKPSIDVFAQTLDLSEAQRVEAQRAIVGSQHEIKMLLETPAEDGTIFLDELVDLMAEGIARPGENKERGMKFFGRLMTETVPGSDDTYAGRAEAVKQRLRDAFRQTWRPEQYAAFDAWKMDPTEVQAIPDSPWKDLEARILERARRLGADIPEAK